MHRMKRKYFSLFIFFVGILLCGFIFDNLEMTLDTEKNIVYQNYDIDKVLSDFSENADLAKADYHKAKIVLWARVSEVTSNNKKVTLISLNGMQKGSIKCSFSEQAVMEDIKTLSPGDTVKVYGEFSVSFIGNHLEMKASKLEKTSTDIVSTAWYSLLNGNTIDRETMDVRTLSEDEITYYIPKDWSEIEVNLIDNQLGSIEGYQYRLNELPLSADVLPESFFVCYFDTKLLKNSSDKHKTEQIERAIISNILGKKPDQLDKFPAKKVEAYYGIKYHYYQDAYRDALGQGYHAEFVFQPVGTDGIIIYLYIYHEAKHLDDIMVLMRLLEIK